MEHSCSHSKHRANVKGEVSLYLKATIITSLVLVIQGYVSYLSGNIALMGDTIHVGADLSTHVGSLLVALLVLVHFTGLDENRLRNTFAWLGVALLLFGAIHTSIEAYEHFLVPKDTANWLVFGVAVFGGIGNLFVHILLHRVPANVRTITHQIMSAHVFADLLMSIGVAISVYIRIEFAHVWEGFVYSDPMAASVVALYMFYLVITLPFKIIKGRSSCH